MLQLFYYSKCGTCRKAEKWLKDNRIHFEYRNIIEQRPTSEEIKNWIKLTQLPINKFFNTSGLLYRELNMKEKIKSLNSEELISIVASNGLLVKRPILIDPTNNNILIGFNQDEWEMKLK
jgi:arsenate reductase